MKNKVGFTLVEVLTTSAVLLFVLAASFSTYVIMSQYIKATTTQTALQSDARIAVERIARNIRLASNAACSVSGDSIVLRFYPGRIGEAGDMWESEYRLTGNQILFFPDTDMAQSEVITNNVNLDVGDRLFEDWGSDLIGINLKLSKDSVSTTQRAGLTTVIRLRNAN